MKFIEQGDYTLGMHQIGIFTVRPDPDITGYVIVT